MDKPITPERRERLLHRVDQLYRVADACEMLTALIVVFAIYSGLAGLIVTLKTGNWNWLGTYPALGITLVVTFAIALVLGHLGDRIRNHVSATEKESA